MSAQISHKELRRVVNYDPATGVFTWKEKVSRKTVIGQRAGCLNKSIGYIAIQIFGVEYYGHRLAHFYMTGKWPKNQMDHKNRNRSDNRWENLREATSSQNRMNSLRKNKWGVKGVYQRKSGSFAAMIRVKGKAKYLGAFKTKERAHQAYKAAADTYFGEFARHKN